MLRPILASQKALIAKLKTQFTDWTLAPNEPLNRPLAMLFGSASSLPMNGNPGVPGVWGVIDLIKNLLDDDEKVEFEQLLKENANNEYQKAFEFLQSYRGQDYANRVIREAVLKGLNNSGLRNKMLDRALKHGDTIACKQIDQSATQWHLNPGVSHAGKMIANYTAFCGENILTTNFDPLLEIAILQNESQVTREVLQGDGTLDHHFNEGARVVHLHGYWYQSDTLHTRIQLTQERKKLKNSLSRLARKHTLLVMGYGGWDDVIMRALHELMEEDDSSFEVLWTFFPDDKQMVYEHYQHVFEKLEPGINRGRVQFYKGIDVNSLLPLVENEFAHIFRTNRVFTQEASFDAANTVTPVSTPEFNPAPPPRPVQRPVRKSSVFEIRPNLSIKKILDRSRPNLDIQVVDEEIDKTKAIGYSFFHGKDRMFPSAPALHFLVLHKDCHIKNTIQALRKKYQSILRTQQLLVLFPKQKEHSNFEIRKNAITRQLKGTKALFFYLDEYLWEFCTPEFFRTKGTAPHNPSFVDPNIKGVSHLTALEYIKGWYELEDSPVLVIKGGGGMGKTTISLKFLETIWFEHTKGIYIDIYEIIHHLDEILKTSGKIDLYSIYSAYLQEYQSEAAGEDRLDRELFRISLDYGNIFIILDSLEEIISRYGDRVDINSFLDSFKQFSTDSKQAKIILTCRDYFWDKNKLTLDFDRIELLPFNQILFKQYFEKTFPTQQKEATKRAFKIARELLGEHDINLIPPFVLDIVKFIISREGYEKHPLRPRISFPIY